MSMQGRRPSSFTAAIHVIPGDAEIPGAGRTVRLRDLLSAGLSHTDVSRHRRLRAEHHTRLWRAIELGPTRVSLGSPLWLRELLGRNITSPQLLRQALSRYSTRLPIVIWTSANSNDRLSLWWVMHAIAFTDLPIERLWIAESLPVTHRDSPLHGHSAQMLESSFASVRPLRSSERRVFSLLWHHFAAGFPRKLTALRGNDGISRQDKDVLDTLCCWTVPRQRTNATTFMRLSEFDQFLLSSLAHNSWTRLIEISVRMLRDESARQLFNLYPANVIGLRIRAWCDHRKHEPAIRWRLLEEGVDFTNRIGYQITPYGASLIENGLKHVNQAPVFPVGGFKAYDRKSPCVRRTGRKTCILDELRL